MAFSKSTVPDKFATTVVEVLSATSEIQTIDADDNTAYVYQCYIDNTLNAGHPCYLKMWCGPYGTGTNQVNITATDGTGLILGGATAAVATIVCHADIATDDTVTIISADATSRTYTAKAASNYGALQFDASGTAAETATALAENINHDGGHDGKLVAAADSATITITNATTGTSGNTTITNNLNAAATVTSFAGGTDDSQVPSGTQEPDFIFYCPAGSTVEYVFPQGIKYTEDLKTCVVTTPGKAGATSMSNQVMFRLTLSET